MTAEATEDPNDLVFVGVVDADTIRPDPENANEGTDRGREMLTRSMLNYGAGRSIVLDRNNIDVAGNKTLDEWRAKGGKVAIVETDGETLLALRRKDFDLLADPESREYRKARGYAYVDNRSSELGLQWNLEQIVRDADRIDLSAEGIFSSVELEDFRAQLDVPDLGDLEDEHGKENDKDYWPVLRLSLPPEVYARYERLMEVFPGEDHESFSSLLDAAEQTIADGP